MASFVTIMHVLFTLCNSDCKVDKCGSSSTKFPMFDSKLPFQDTNGCGRRNPSFWQELGQELVFHPLRGQHDYHYICDWHDMCYSICGISQHFCDDVWSELMYLQCLCIQQDAKFSCDIWHSCSSWIMKNTDCKSGEAYYDSQKEACKCQDITKTDIKKTLKPITDKLKAKKIKFTPPNLKSNVVSNIKNWLVKLMWNPEVRKALIKGYDKHEPDIAQVRAKSNAAAKGATKENGRAVCKLFASGTNKPNALAKYLGLQPPRKLRKTKSAPAVLSRGSAYMMDENVYGDENVFDEEMTLFTALILGCMMVLCCALLLGSGFGCGLLVAKLERKMITVNDNV